MLKSQMWGSDSCGCVFEEDYDDENPDIKTLKRTIFICDSHNPEKNDWIKSVQDSYHIAHEDNTQKEKLRQAIIDSNALPMSAIDTVTSYDEETKTIHTTKNLHNNIIFKYYYQGTYNKDDDDDDSRKIVYSLEGMDKNLNVLNLDNNQKSSLDTTLSQKIGRGKCVQKDLITENTDEEYKKALQDRNVGKTEFMREHARLQEQQQLMAKAKEGLSQFFSN